MARYSCYNCRDEDLGTRIPQIIKHVWRKHGIELSWNMERVYVHENNPLRDRIHPLKNKLGAFRNFTIS